MTAGARAKNKVMTPPDDGFHYRVGSLARFFGGTGLREVALSNNLLRLTWADDRSEVFVPEEILPPVRRGGGFFWCTVRFEDVTGTQFRLGGIPHEQATALVRILESWIAPARARYFANVDTDLTAVEARLSRLLGESRFVRRSQVETATSTLQEVCQRLARPLAAPDRPESLRHRHAALKEALANLPARVLVANERFIAAEMNRHQRLFDTVEAKPLTAAQRRACVIDDDHNLVLAGAGTGKTSVMIGRVGYTLSAGLAEASAILMVAYNRDAAREMRERAATRLAGIAGAEALTIKTFHALGKEILAEVDGKQPSVSPLAEDESKLHGFITRLLDESLKEPEYAAKFIEYGFDLHQPHRSLFDFKNMEEYERELARLDLRTLQDERVKSHEELRIANFLARNGVEYAYERPFPIRTADRQHRQYRPDFTIERSVTESGEVLGPLFLEHFGVDRQGNPPPFFNEAQAATYRAGVEWKRRICKEHDLPLIETYSYQFRPEVVFDRLSEQLAAHGVPLRPRSDAECLDMLRGSSIVSDTAKLFAELVPIVREYGIQRVEIERRIAGMAEHERGRAHLLWELLKPLIEGYERQLAAAGEIDFADMISRATHLAESGQFRSPFTHILVDEFQDISGPRAKLVLALARQRSDSSVFCVGDDWQAIYRFAGSDVRYTSHFEQLIGPGTTTALDRTFRFNNQIGRVASAFVTKNPAQLRKNIESVRIVDKPAVSLVPTAEPHLGIEAILRRIDAWGQSKGERYSVFVLARYRYELTEPEGHFRSLGTGRFPGLGEVQFRSVHGVKGREADFVILTGLEAGRNGFPADKPTDPFHDLFLPPKEAFEFADERRLFYVALTRAKHRVYLVFDAVSHSPFVRELIGGGYPIAEGEFSGTFIQARLPVVPCPQCATGEIRPRSSTHGVFYGCHRFPICTYRERGCGSCRGLLLRVGQYRVCSNPNCDGVHLECPKCRAPMEHRSGRYGPFFGCSNFGRVDLLEQCAATEKMRRLPSAHELRSRAGMVHD